MRQKINPQPELDLYRSNLKVTNEYYEKYEAISRILDQNPKILDLVHKDLKQALKSCTTQDSSGSRYQYTSDTALRILICQIVEGCSLREIIIRIDDSNFLRQFVRIYGGPMMDFTTLCKLKNGLSPETWKKINHALAQHAVEQALIDGDKVRLDTSAVETNIHWPTDSSLLWDDYRVLARLITAARELDAEVVGNGRLQTRKAKKLAVKIARKGSQQPQAREALKPLYSRLIELVTGIGAWAQSVRAALLERKSRYGILEQASAERLASELAHYRDLGLRVIDQATRRVLRGESVPNEEKLFSIFEPHTELLKRGKAAKPIEFGHMIQIQQVGGKFITDYDVFEKKPVEYELLEEALASHHKLFGHPPDTLAADKGYYQDMSALDRLEKKVELVAIAKKGSLTPEQKERESDPDFRFAQRFRAGVEGTISFLKRVLGLFRCLNRGWEHYVSTIGAAIFTHNLLILARC
ncbi:MAG: ISNCY family transposase [Gammaproteobacteria bacterium]